MPTGARTAGHATSTLNPEIEIDPKNLMIHWCIGYAYALLGRLADASRHANVLRDMGPDVPYTRRDQLRLALEPRQTLAVVGECGGEHLDRDVAIQPGVARAIDLAHPAGADGADNFVRSESGPNREMQAPGL